MKHKFDLSITALFICLIAWLFTQKQNNREEQDIISSDVIQYYSYLPAYFIHHDLSLKFLDTMQNIPNNSYWHLKTPEGKKYFKMTMGMAMLYSPFFAIGHNASLNSKVYKANGFTQHYKSWLVIGTLLYAFLGLLFLRKLLLNFFNNTAVGITLIILGIGTNLFCYVTHDVLMSHAYSFFLFSLFLLLTVNWHKNKTIINAIGIGLTLGLITLIRPTNIIIGTAFLLYDVNSLKEFQTRVNLYLKNYLHIILILIAGITIWIPQFFYWKMQTGSYFFYSYTGENFFWTNPHLYDILFSWRKGLFIYTPLIILGFVGIIFLKQYTKQWSTVLYIFIPLNLYIISCWWCWWYGGSFSQRALIDSFPLLAIPMCAAVSQILKSNAIVQQAVALLVIFGIQLNIFQTKQYTSSLLHYDSMSKETYFKIFWKNNWFDGYDNTLIPTDSDNAIKGLPERDLRKQHLKK